VDIRHFVVFFNCPTTVTMSRRSLMERVPSLRSVRSLGSFGSLRRVPSLRSIKTSDLSKALASENWTRALSLVKSKPDTAKVWNGRPGFFEGIKHAEVLPIHEACANSETPIELIEAIIQAHPEGLQLKESAYKRLPIHIACRKNASIDVVTLLLEHYPDGALIADTLGRLALHYALSNGANDEVIGTLLNKKPGSARGTDRRGWLPLHVACSVGASTKVIAMILEAYPEGSVIQTNRGTSVERCMDSHRATNKEEVLGIIVGYRVKIEEQLNRQQAPEITSDRTIV